MAWLVAECVQFPEEVLGLLLGFVSAPHVLFLLGCH